MILSSYWRLIRGNRNFCRLWLAQIVSEMGDWFYLLAIYSLLLQLTGRAQSVGLALVLQLLPCTIAGPTAGVVNDRIRRRHIMIATDLARMIIVLGMMLVRSRETVWLIYPLLFLETVMWGFFEPARRALVPDVVGEDQLLAANTASSITSSFNFAVGPVLGGLVAVVVGRNAVFVLNALSFLSSALLIGTMRIHEPHAAETPPFHLRELVDFSPMAEGARYIRSDAKRFATVLLNGGIGIMGTNWVLFPIMGERVFPVHMDGVDGSRDVLLGMSLLMGARGVGTLIAPLVATRWADERSSRMRVGILIAFMAGAVGYVLLSQAPTLALALLSVALAHGGGSTISVFSTTLLQRFTDAKFRGRVFAADLAVSTLVIAMSGYLAGVAIDRGVGVGAVAFWTGAAMLVPGLMWLWAMCLWREQEGQH